MADIIRRYTAGHKMNADKCTNLSCLIRSLLQVEFAYIFDIIELFKTEYSTRKNRSPKQYPCKQEKFVRRVDVIEQKTDVTHGIKYRRSIAFCHNVIPWILRTIGILNEKAILLEEESWFDQRKKRVEIKSRNLTWSKYAHLWEKSVFRSDETNPSWTVFEQHGSIDVHGIGPFGRVIEMFAEEFLHTGVKRSLNIMESLLEERYKNGQTDHS